MIIQKFFTLILVTALFTGCADEDSVAQISGGGDWLIPRSAVFDGGPGKDGIPALSSPRFLSVADASYLSDDDLVLGYQNGDETRAYPHPILDWHEIINDKVDDHAIAVTYCPLTGTGIGWERTIDGRETTFGVSGLLYNSNLIPYDRLTDSNWSQMRLDCVNGELIGNQITTFPLVETTWATWKKLYPDTEVVSDNTGHNRNYNRYPYGDYRTNHSNLIFPVDQTDNRLSNKERVLGIIVDSNAKVYRFTDFSSGINAIHDDVGNLPVVVAGSQEANFLVAFERTLADGTQLTFEAYQSTDHPNRILTDEEGNFWDIFGTAVSGPRAGEQLKPTKSFIGYWFSWAAFYPDAAIYSGTE